jgi:hypothetical protein
MSKKQQSIPIRRKTRLHAKPGASDCSRYEYLVAFSKANRERMLSGSTGLFRTDRFLWFLPFLDGASKRSWGRL